MLEKQWVKSPLAGLISEVGVKSVTAKRVTLEVLAVSAIEFARGRWSNLNS